MKTPLQYISIFQIAISNLTNAITYNIIAFSMLLNRKIQQKRKMKTKWGRTKNREFPSSTHRNVVMQCNAIFPIGYLQRAPLNVQVPPTINQQPSSVISFENALQLLEYTIYNESDRSNRWEREKEWTKKNILQSKICICIYVYSYIIRN